MVSFLRVSFFTSGRRPADIFFLTGSVWSALALAISAGAMTGAIPWAAHLGSTAWHVHELIFGAVGAVIAGFLLSAVPNWTGRRPIAGVPLAVLFALWLAGRIAMLAVAPQDPATLACSLEGVVDLALSDEVGGLAG